jgi:hypothetical protein
VRKENGRHIALTLCPALLLLISSQPAAAEIKVIEADHSDTLGGYASPADARRIARQQSRGPEGVPLR